MDRISRGVRMATLLGGEDGSLSFASESGELMRLSLTCAVSLVQRCSCGGLYDAFAMTEQYFGAMLY